MVFGVVARRDRSKDHAHNHQHLVKKAVIVK
jgi:hypothetical protein